MQGIIAKHISPKFQIPIPEQPRYCLGDKYIEETSQGKKARPVPQKLDVPV